MHVLVVPKRHIATLNDLRPRDDALVGEMVRRARRRSPRARASTAAGYRTVFNCNAMRARRCSTSTCICSAGATTDLAAG